MIVKKFSIVVCLLAIFALTGCGKSNQVVCKMSANESGMNMDQVVKLDIKSDKVESASIEMKIKLDASLKSYKSILLSNVKSQFSTLEEQYNAKVNVKETSDGFTINVKLSKDALESEYGSGVIKTKAEAITYFENEGYTCK